MGPEKKNRQGKRKQRKMYESEQAEKKAKNFFIKMIREIYSIRLFKKIVDAYVFKALKSSPEVKRELQACKE
jgi:hypothetical protein